jgi:hypothetical protein
MFSHPDIQAQKAGNNSQFKTLASKAVTITTDETRKGLTNAIAAFGIIKSNCNNACLSALDINNTKLDILNRGQYDSCVRRCFVERLKSHFPNDDQVVDFAYASAFTYDQEDHFYLNIHKVGLNKITEDVKFQDIESLSKSFNTYFS